MQFLNYLTQPQSRRLADVTAAVVVADLDRMMAWCLRRITTMPHPPADAKPASTPFPPGPSTSSASAATEGQTPAPLPLLPPPLPPLHLPALPLDREAAKRLLQAHPSLGSEYVAMRRREGRQSSILPHLQAFLQLPVTQIKGEKRARVDSIISPQLREGQTRHLAELLREDVQWCDGLCACVSSEFMKWLQEEKRLSAKCSKNYLGEISAMLKQLVRPTMERHEGPSTPLAAD